MEKERSNDSRYEKKNKFQSSNLLKYTNHYYFKIHV